MERYKIRAHHGMCLAFFEGKGYSDDFTRHMGSVKKELENNPVICLVDETDEICKCCPNNKNEVCESEDKVLSYDEAVLRLCGLKAGTWIEWSIFSTMVAEHIINTGKRVDICGDCDWNTICKEFFETE